MKLKAKTQVPKSWLKRPVVTMYEDGTNIQWTWDYLSSDESGTIVRKGHTFNPWWGCTRVSPACDFCYADATAACKYPLEKVWGAKARRRFFKIDHWKLLPRLDKRAQRDGLQIKVFVASMCDYLEILHSGHKNKEQMEMFRGFLFDNMLERRHLLFQTLTKRPQNIVRLMPVDLLQPYGNVWLGITAENQEWFDRRWDHIKDLPNVLFLSVEPMLGRLTLPQSFLDLGQRGWVIVGGESGPLGKIRPYCLEDWRYLRDQCLEAGVPVFHKQYGESTGPKRRNV